MEKAKVLFVAQEITPYLKETPMSTIGRYLPQGIQDKGAGDSYVYAALWKY